MSITADSFTGSPSLDKLVLAFIIVRIAVCAVLCVLAGYQAALELITLKRKKINPRLIVLVSVSLCYLFRILYCIAVIKEKSIDYGSLSNYFGIWSVFASCTELFFIWCFRYGLIFMMFSLEEIDGKRSIIGSVWISSCVMTLITFLYTLANLFTNKYASNYASGVLYSAGFISILVIGICVMISHGVKLYGLMKEHKETLLSEKVRILLFKSKVLAIVIATTVVIALIRDLVLFVIGLANDDNWIHLSIFITFLIETAQGVTIMFGIAKVPKNYILFKSINPVAENSFIEKSPVSLKRFNNTNSLKLTELTISNNCTGSSGSHIDSIEKDNVDIESNNQINLNNTFQNCNNIILNTQVVSVDIQINTSDEQQSN